MGFGGVEASNAASDASVVEVGKCRDEAKKILETIGDESLLLRADCQLALALIFKLLKNPEADPDFKDVVSCVQRLAAIGDSCSSGREDRGDEGRGLSGEALEEIEGRLKIM